MHLLKKNLFVRMLYHMYKLSSSRHYRQTHSIISFSSQFHYLFSPYLIFPLYPLLYLIKLYLVKKRLLISVNNITTAVGHIYPEIDWIYRLYKVNRICLQSKVLYVYPKSEILLGIKNILSGSNVKVICSSSLHFFLYLTALAFPVLSVNTSHSNMNHGRLNWFSKSRDLSFRETFEKRQLEYAKIRAQTRNFWPLLRENIHNAFCLNLPAKYIVLQIKTSAINGTLEPTNPETLIPLLKNLQKRQYTLIFGGREKMPDCLIELGVINYANSADATPHNDYYLIRNASFVICSASGFSYIPDVLGVPTLQINAYGITSITGQNSLILPALLNIENKPISYSMQLEQFYRFGQLLPGRKIPEDWTVISANADDIVESFKELEKIIDMGDNYIPSVLQKKFKEIFKGQVPGEAICNYSNYFLKKNIERLSCE